MQYLHIEFPLFLKNGGYNPTTVECPKESYRLMDSRARLAARGEFKGRSDFITDPRDLLIYDSEAPYLLRFACAASRVRLT
jgi:hypothetical protein